jgi:hypothetical protein
MADRIAAGALLAFLRNRSGAPMEIKAERTVCPIGMPVGTAQ